MFDLLFLLLFRFDQAMVAFIDCLQQVCKFVIIFFIFNRAIIISCCLFHFVKKWLK